jgi:mono/diheme cytochrome c family protein
MPAFGEQLSSAEINAVLAYIRALPNPVARRASNATVTTPVKLPKDIAQGRELFFDSSRLPDCSACHAVGDMGAGIAAKLTSIASVDALRSVRTINVRTAHVEGEPSFPALLGEVTSDSIRIYDLSSPLPVLRTFPKTQVELKEGSNWDHGSVVKQYSQPELELILKYIREMDDDL